jgi:two-component system chemotaxis response regulator CheB
MMNEEGLVRDVFVVGAAAGGIEAILDVFHRLPADLPAVIAVALHRSPRYASQLCRVIGRRAPLPVREPADGETIRRGHVYLAPRDTHLIANGERWQLHRGPRRHGMRPAIDLLFSSAASFARRRAVGVLLSAAAPTASRA